MVLSKPDTERLTTTVLNLRDNPSGNAIGKIEKGTLVHIYDVVDDWAKIDDGWVYAGYLTDADELSPISVECDSLLASSAAGHLQYALAKLPDEVEQMVADAGYRIILTDSELMQDNRYNEGYSDVDIYGVTIYDKKLLICEVGMSCFEYVVLHEIGHAYDDANGFFRIAMCFMIFILMK